MNSATSLQIIKHGILLIIVFSFEIGGELGLLLISKKYPTLASINMLFSIAFVFSIFCFFFIGLLEKSELMRDMQEIFLYDILVQLYGAWSTWMEYGSYFPHLLVNVVLLLKLSRILWVDTNSDFGDDKGWPIFGLLGLYTKLKNKKPAIEKSAFDRRRDRLIYLNIAASFLVAFVLKEIGLISVSLILCCAIPVVVIGLFYKKFIKYLEEAEELRIGTNQRLAVANATAALSHELSEKNQQLVTANQQLDKMLADLTVRNEYLRDASHDLAAPAFWITSCAQQIVAAENSVKREQLAKQLLDSVSYYNQLLQTTIHSAKLITKIDQPQIKNISVNKIADYFWDKYWPLFEEKGLRFSIYKANQYVINPDGDVIPDTSQERIALRFSVATDENILMRILNNLMMNALRNTQQGRIMLAFRRRRNGVCWIEVRDTGMGFEGADQNDWHENFTQVAAKIKAGRFGASEAASHGLGISNIRNLSVSLHSPMMLYSKKGQGSIFRFIVPLGSEEAGEASKNQLYYFG